MYPNIKEQRTTSRKGGSLPEKVFCSRCGTVLYEHEELRPPDEIIQIYNGKCPNCGKKLSLIPRNVEIIPIGPAE